jgi:AIR carboxylase
MVINGLGAAHLPGMVAAMTPLPVIGVPVKATHLDGLDSLLSIVQMPVNRHLAIIDVLARNSGGHCCYQQLDQRSPVSVAHPRRVKTWDLRLDGRMPHITEKRSGFEDREAGECWVARVPCQEIVMLCNMHCRYNLELYINFPTTIS